MLTATPINNRLRDFRHMTELFTRREENYFARTLGINNLRAHFNNMERQFNKSVGSESADVADYRLSGDGPDKGDRPKGNSYRERSTLPG